MARSDTPAGTTQRLASPEEKACVLRAMEAVTAELARPGEPFAFALVIARPVDGGIGVHAALGVSDRACALALAEGGPRTLAESLVLFFHELREPGVAGGLS
jgi:hypothetical protein